MGYAPQALRFAKGIIKQRATTALAHALVITVIRVVYHRTARLNDRRYRVEYVIRKRGGGTTRTVNTPRIPSSIPGSPWERKY